MQTAIEAGSTPETMPETTPDTTPDTLAHPPGSPPVEARPPAPLPQPGAPPARPEPANPPGALAALCHGARRVVQQPRLLFFIWGLSMVTAMAASSPALVTLGTLLGRRPAAARLARGGADYLLGELVGDNPASVAAILGSVLVAALVFFIAWLVLSGGVLSALRRPGDPQRVGPAIGPIIARGLATAGAMLRLELTFLLVLRVPLMAVCVAGLLLLGRGKFADNHTLLEITWRFTPMAALSLVLWCGGTVVLYAARLQRLAQTAGTDSTLRALAGGVRRSLGSWAAVRATLLFAVTDAVFMSALIVLGRVLAARLDYALLVIAALLVRQGFALLRSALTLTIMASTVELCTAAE